MAFKHLLLAQKMAKSVEKQSVGKHTHIGEMTSRDKKGRGRKRESSKCKDRSTISRDYHKQPLSSYRTTDHTVMHIGRYFKPIHVVYSSFCLTAICNAAEKHIALSPTTRQEAFI